ncbi:hypothetical protein PHMEG_00033087 [Phytophthora megakarya]|uniref:Ankyrin repeat-containing domain n=1 Tax=Phytophthora megakarya TaxID=4795 RepID=A0A225UV26_9STRA|nr:hypothetical protein PHMEG_00033087 [Phytophthora megakarya]
MDITASRGHLEVLKWLHQYTSASCTTKAMDGAAEGGYLDAIKWLHRNRSEGCTSVAMAEAAANGHWRVMKWLHEHVPDDCSSPVIDHAARACHFECVLFLNRSRQEMVSEEVAHSASSVISNPGLQNWVLENLGRVGLPVQVHPVGRHPPDHERLPDSAVEMEFCEACKLNSIALLERIWTASLPASEPSPAELGPGNGGTWSRRKYLRTDRHYNRFQFRRAWWKL